MSGDVNVRITATDQASGAFRAVSAEAVKFGAVVGGAAAAALGMMTAFVKQSITAADELGKLSQKLGISVEDLAGFKHAADLSDISINQFAQGVKQLSRFMTENGVSMKAAGVTATDAKGALIQLADGFSQMPDGAQKTAIAMKLMGRAGAEMIPLFNGGGAALQQMMDEGQRLNPITTDMAKNAEKFNDNLTRLTASVRTTSVAIASDLLPPLVLLTERLQQSFAGGLVEGFTSRWSAAFKGLAAGINESLAASSEFLAKITFGSVAENHYKQALRYRDSAKKFYAELSALVPPIPGGQIASAKIDINKLVPPKKPAGAGRAVRVDSSFDTLLKQISEKSALLALDAQETTKLTDAQRMALKVMTDLQGGYLKLTDAQKELLAGKLEEMLANDQLNQSTEARRKAIEEERKAIEEYLKEEERMQALVADFIGGGRTQIERTGQVSETIGMRARDREILEANRRLEDDALAARRRAFSDIKDPQLYQQAIEGINAALVRQKSELSAVTGAAYDYATSWESGVKTAISSYLDEIDDMATSMNNVVTKAFNGMEDALVSFVQTGKLDFRSLADSIIADMLRISIRENITGPLAKWAGSLFENADGGVYSGPGISAYSGQVVSRPTVFPFASGIGLMGEAGPEAILPLKRGANGKLGVEGGGAQTIIVNVTSTTGDRAEIRRSAASGARAALGIMSGARRYG